MFAENKRWPAEAEVPTGRRADLSEDWRSLREVLASPDDAVHDGLGITEAQLVESFMKIISDGMSEKRYPADVQAEFMAIWRSFRDSVVQKRSSRRTPFTRQSLHRSLQPRPFGI